MTDQHDPQGGLPPEPNPTWEPASPSFADAAAALAPSMPVAQPLPPAPPVAGTATGGARGYSRWIVLVLAPVLAIVMFAGGVAVGNGGRADGTPSAVATPRASGGDADLALIEEAWRAINDNYVDAKNLDTRDLAYGAIRGMTEAVGDEGHTTFLTAEESKAMDQSLSGTFVGIGVQVDSDPTDVPIIRTVIPNTPAEEAGLRRGDQIVKVDGKATSGESIDEVVSRVRGPEGEPVTLTIERAGNPAFDVTIVRRKFDLPLVTWAMVPGRKIAVIRLDQFASGATKAIEDAINGAKDAGATALVLDLRGNPGGYVNEAVGVTSQFVGDGTVYRSIDASGTEKDVPVAPGGLATDIPLVVLADGDTASSGEIVTGAIQDARRAKVVGEKTFGTGTVLGRFDLADGSSLRVGVERWLTRGGRPIWHEGLEPDIKVALSDTATPVVPDDLRGMTAAQLAASTDAQLLRALEELKGKG